MPFMLVKCTRPDGQQAPVKKVAACFDTIDDMMTDERSYEPPE